MTKIRYLILSKGRPEICFNTTYSLTKHLNPFIVIEPQEEIDYLKFFRKDQLIILPFSNKGLTMVRHWCLTNFNDDIIWMFDDDLKHMFKRDGLTGLGNHKLVHTKVNFDNINKKLIDEDFAQAGITFKPSNWYFKGDFKIDTRICAVTAFNMDILKKNNINYDLDVLIFHDYDITAQILSKGLHNFASYEYAFDTKMAGDSKGVSVYRTKALSKQICDLLKKKWGVECELTSREIYEPQFKWKDIIKNK